tara:strand:- start:5 stop:577 length:573 start_codon:yes stop_codon:yes gene_type:complete
MARIVRLEKGLGDSVEYEVVQTRGENNPYYNVNPSGRVPSLILDDGTVLEESALICWYLDYIDGKPKLHPADGINGLEQRRIEAIARSMLDGISLWLREYIYRPPEMHSETIIDHERRRASRLADVFEKEVEGEILSGPINMAQITLACVFHGNMIDSLPEFAWQEGRPHLCNWVERIGQNLSVKETAPA